MFKSRVDQSQKEKRVSKLHQEQVTDRNDDLSIAFMYFQQGK